MPMRISLRKKLVSCTLLVAGAFFAARVAVVSAFHDDACEVISIAVAGMLERGAAVSPETLNATVAGLIEASVINGRIDGDGNPTDYCGKPFEIVVADGSVTTSTRRSAFHPFESRATSNIEPNSRRTSGWN